MASAQEDRQIPTALYSSAYGSLASAPITPLKRFLLMSLMASLLLELMGPFMSLSLLTSQWHLTLSATYFFLIFFFFFSFYDIIFSCPLPHFLLDIVFQACFSLDNPQILVLPSALGPLLRPLLFVSCTFFTKISCTPMVSIITYDICSLELSMKLWTCAV